MRFLLLSADIVNPMPNIGDFFITQGIEQLLAGHECRRLPIHRRPRQHELDFAREFDVLIVCGTNLIGAGGTVRCGWTVEDFRVVGKPVVPLGLGSQADRGQPVQVDAAGVSLLKFWFESSGQLSVRDSLTLEACHRLLGDGTAALTGCPSIGLAPKNQPHLRQHLVFCPPPYHYRTDWMKSVDWPGRLITEFIRHLGTHRSVIYLAQQPSDLLFNASEAGWRTVYSPLFPDHHLELLSSAREIVSFRIHPCLVGVAEGSPAVVLCLDARTESLAETYGIPFLRVASQSTPEELWELCRQKFESYPWAEIRERLPSLRQKLDQHLTAKAITTQRAAKIASQRAIAIACISDQRCFGQLLGLIENLKRLGHAALKVHLLVLDEQTQQWADQHLSGISLHCYQLNELWSQAELTVVGSRSVAEQAYSSKARLLKSAVSETGDSVIFCDTDLFFFTSPASLIDEIPAKGALLFPHWNQDRPENRWHGLYNSGLLGVAAGAEDFLEWWAQKGLTQWGKSRRRGLFFEQAFLDHAPLLFANMRTYRGLDQNVGPWNVMTSSGASSGLSGAGFRVRLPEELPWRPVLASGRPLGSYHAASPDALGLYEIKTSWDQVMCLVHGLPFASQSESFREWLVTAQARHWPALKRVMFLYQTLRYRMGIPLGFPSPGMLNMLTRGPVNWGITWLSRCYGFWRDTGKKILGKPLQGVELLAGPGATNLSARWGRP